MKRIGAALLFFLASGAALAQDYPAKPVVILVPAAAGGPTGVTKAAKARADGYTLLLYHIGMATAPTLYRKLQYDTLNDFDYVGQVADVPMMLIAKKATPAANFAEFLAYAKANKDKVSYANASVGSASYLCGLLFMSAVQTDFTQVPYKGTGPTPALA